MDEKTKEVDFRTAFKANDGKVEDAALPPVETSSGNGIMVPPQIEEKFRNRMMQNWYVMNESMRAALQVIDQHIPSALSITPGVSPVAAEGIRFQTAAILASKLFEEMKSMVDEIKFVEVAAKE